MSSRPQQLRILVACGSCKRQYDASQLAPRSRFRCRCGELVVVPAATPHDAAVVRCASCGGPRDRDAASCGYCGAEFTLGERERQTLCPSCMARVSDHGRYCHHCATPIVAEEDAGRPTPARCPACGKDHLLTSRTADEHAPAVLECPRCSGLWLGQAALQVVLDRARAAALPEGAAPAPANQAARERPLPQSPPQPQRQRERQQQQQQGNLYRPCPFCEKLMNRQNYARRSGVIIDSCKEHGIWFDARELESVLQWVRAGGERRAEESKQEEERNTERLARLQRDIERTDSRWRHSEVPATSGEMAWVESLLAGLFDLKRQ